MQHVILILTKGEHMTKLERYLEEECYFRDYSIYNIDDFRTVNKVAIHQVVSPDDFHQEVDDAINTFCRDGYGHICFYLEE